MKNLIHYFTHGYAAGSLYNREKTKTLVIACLITIITLAIGIAIHYMDHKPVIVLMADAVFFFSALIALYLVKSQKPILAANIYIVCLLALITTHSIATDFYYAHNLSYYRIIETTLLFTLALLSVAFFMQGRNQILFTVILGFISITAHYLIIANKTSVNPFETHPFSILLSSLILFSIISFIAYRMLRTFTRLIQKTEDEAFKVKMYNTELESMVSERTQTLELQNEALKKVNSELDRFVYSASHDLRAPLTSILGLIQLAKMEENTDKIKEYLGLKEKSVNKLDKFIQDIVHVSKNARTEIRQDKIDFHHLIHSTLDQLDYMENSSQVQKIVEVHQDISFYSDEHRLSIILNNLLSNAIRYAVPHRRDAFVKIQVNVEDGLTTLEVEDNGLGIAQDHLEKVFSMFFRANHDIMGSGLGLYIVKETTGKLCGDIGVVSTLGKGTIFTVKIPNEVPWHSLTKIQSD